MHSFRSIWDNHPVVTKEPALLDRTVYENQCAINLGAALMRAGFNLSGYTGVLSWQRDKPKYPIRAQELATWLEMRPAVIGSRVEKFGAKEAFTAVKSKEGILNRTGIVFIQNFWGTGLQGDHIDCWNGHRLTDWLTWARLNIRVGDYGLHDIGFGSDYLKAQSVWFWALS